MRTAAAIAWLTLVEAWRLRLWLALAAAAAAIIALAPALNAVDDAGRLKLTVVTGSMAGGFTAVLLALLVAPAQVRRDLDQRVAFLLFAKPLGRGSYVLGRFAGACLIAAAGLGAAAAATLTAAHVRLDAAPQMRSAERPAAILEVSQLGEATPLPEAQERVQLGGPAGNGVRWRFTGLHGDAAREVLLRIRCHSTDPEVITEEVPVEVAALAADGGAPRRLALAPASPYGRGTARDETRPGEVWLRHREASRQDLSADYARLELPADAIAADGSLTVQLTRLDGRSVMSVARDGSCLVSAPGGGLGRSLALAALAGLAPAAMLVAAGILIASLSGVAVALLAGLTLHFCTQVHSVLRDTLEYEQVSAPVRRLMELALAAFPDAERHDLAARLAASQAATWGDAGSAWLAYAPWTAALLACAWFALARREFR